ncbi:MAG: DUF4838 domain-containing protein [Clostridia bacterium]|nr:DUF4838 domain-containing protein [Clostridia bacterium]
MKKSLLIHPEELSVKWVDRMVDAGCDTLALHPTGGANAHESLQRMLDRLQDADYRALLDYADARGLKVEYAMHTARFLLPADLFDEHPDYFRENAEGQRVCDHNLCASNEAALDLFAQNALALAKKLYKTSDTFYFWMDDVRDGFCHCEKCRRMTPSEQQLTVMNRVIQVLRTEFPNARLAYLAYQICLPCPASVKPAEGIFLEYAPFDRDFDKKAEEMPEDQIKNIKDLLSYFGKDDARVLEYWYDNSLFSRWKKPPKQMFPKNHLIPADLAFYRSLGFEDIASFACFLGEDYEALYGDFDLSAYK